MGGGGFWQATGNCPCPGATSHVPDVDCAAAPGPAQPQPLLRPTATELRAGRPWGGPSSPTTSRHRPVPCGLRGRVTQHLPVSSPGRRARAASGAASGAAGRRRARKETRRCLRRSSWKDDALVKPFSSSFRLLVFCKHRACLRHTARGTLGGCRGKDSVRGSRARGGSSTHAPPRAGCPPAHVPLRSVQGAQPAPLALRSGVGEPPQVNTCVLVPQSLGNVQGKPPAARRSPPVGGPGLSLGTSEPVLPPTQPGKRKPVDGACEDFGP